MVYGRYHVAGSKGVYYAREPYMNDDAAHATRFIGLAPVGNASKQVGFTLLVNYLTIINPHFLAMCKFLSEIYSCNFSNSSIYHVFY